MNYFSQQCEKMDDAEIVVLALESQGYFVCLMDRYQAPLLRYIRRISNLSHEEAEDVLQDVFIKIYQNLNDYDSDLKFSSWVYRITHNEVISNFRKIKARPQSVDWEISDWIIENIMAEMDLEKEMDLEYLQKNIKKILNKLDKKYKEVLILKYLEDKDYQEISDILKKPMGTVATLLSRAKKKFAEKLADNEQFAG